VLAARAGNDELATVNCAVWGVLNVTPDSFSDGGDHLDRGAAIAHGRRLLAQGADVIDVGGESTRPRGRAYGSGHEEVGVAEELDRVLPVIEALAAAGAKVSIDTQKAEVARAALRAGATIVNDVSARSTDALLEVVREHGVELVRMHNRSKGEVEPSNTVYDDVVGIVMRELEEEVGRAARAGIARERIWIDPGIGFAKTAEQSLEVLRRLDAFVGAGHRVLVGPSRKAFIAHYARDADGALPAPKQRVGGTVAAVVWSALAGVDAVRVHDVHEARQALLLVRALGREAVA
jgi:dihydropteroate synthase